MKTILLGFSDVAGKGKATILAGVEVPIRDQTLALAEIKRSGKYPEDIVRVEHCTLNTIAVGIEINAAAKVQAEENAAREQRIKAASKKPAAPAPKKPVTKPNSTKKENHQ